jgi:hypothetical protein
VESSSATSTVETSFFLPFLATLNKALAGIFSDEPGEKDKEGFWTITERKLSSMGEPGPFFFREWRDHRFLIFSYLQEKRGEWGRLGVGVRFSSKRTSDGFLGVRVL